MAMWLKCGSCELAFDDDIVPYEAFARLGELDALATQAREDAATLQGFAHAEAGRVQAEAHIQADALMEKARKDASAVTRLGYAQGRRDALRHWHAEAVAQRKAAAALYGGQRELLADLVVQATASLLQGPSLGGYFESALRAIDSLAERDQTINVTVHPDDQAVALEAVERLRGHWRDGTVVKLTASADVAAGSCICESPQGYIDASLSLQLASLRQAAMGALEDLRLPEDVLAPEAPVTAGDAAPAVREPARTQYPVQPLPPGFYEPQGSLYDLDGDEDEEDSEDEDDNFDGMFDRDPGPDGAPPAGPRRPW